MTRLSLPCLVVLTAFSLAAQAQSQAPGLWESTMKMKTDDGRMEAAMAEMQKQLAAMSPEQRQQVQAAMSRGNVQLGAGGATVKVCITKEQAANPTPHMQGNCKSTDLQRTSNSMKFKFACSTPRNSSGDGEWTFTSDKTYTGIMHATSEAAGKTQQMTIETSGHWVAADCGDVKPFKASDLPAGK